jgi:hypothetical protein
MRLTLRTLLAYLDDTLPPSEAKAMGSKLAESEPAQEIVERIKNVIRRRRLTVPPAASRMDPNTIAEYLDNEITPEAAEELERICLASDVHLAEVSACHQILSLVLGEPTSAPDEAIKRMYALGKGAITAKPPKRHAPSAAITEKAPHVDREADETLRMGLPSVFGKDRANRAMIFAGAALASLLLVVAVMQLLKRDAGPDGNSGEQVANLDSAKGNVNKGPEIIKALPMPAPAPAPVPVDNKPDPPPEVKVPPANDVKADEGLPPPVFKTLQEQKPEAPQPEIPYGPPSAKVTPIGQLIDPGKDQVSIVVQRIPKTNEWKRLSGKQELLSARPLVSLPGSKAVFVTKKGVRLTLWGNIPEHISGPIVYESMAELYDHDTLDLDMTHHRGRVLIENLVDAPVVARVRFENSSEPGGPENYLTLTLTGKNAQVMLDRISFFIAGEPFFKSKDDPERKGPISQMACVAIAGTIHLKMSAESVTLQPPPNANLAVWTSTMKKLSVMPIPEMPFLSAKATTPPDVAKTRLELVNAFTNREVDVGLAELLRANDSLTRRTAVRCLGAMDDLPGLFDALNQDKIEQRVAAVETLIHWIKLSRDNDYKLNDVVRQRLKVNETDTFMDLLHGFSEQAAGRPETYELLIGYLNHNQAAIRELAAWNLYHMVPAAQNILYDAFDPVKRERARQQWLNLIPPGKLPPPPPPAPGAPKGKVSLAPRSAPFREEPTATAGRVPTMDRRPQLVWQVETRKDK